MTYIGFLSTVRDRVLSAQAPTGFTQSGWANIHKQVRNESSWDQAVFDAIQTRQPAPIFTISDDLRGQIQYWKNRRNDCAHSKPNEISHAHVEALWLFVQSNLAKFVVNGSRQGLLAKIQRHYDPSFTPPGTDVSPLAMEVSSAIDHIELSQFFESVSAALGTSYWTSLSLRADAFDFFSAVLTHSDQSVARSLVTYLCSDEKLAVGFLRLHPERLTFFSEHSSVLRRVWSIHLFTDGSNDFPLYAALLRSGLIKGADLERANDMMVNRLRGAIPHDTDVDVLRRSGLFARLEDAAFSNNRVDKFDWGNPNALFIRWYLEYFPISDIAVRSICQCFSAEPCAHGPRDALIELFQENADKRHEFLAIAQRLGVSLPRLISSLVGADVES